MKKPLERLRSIMEDKGFPAVLISRQENVYYLSGFSGSLAYLVITPEKAQLLTDFRYVEQATKEAPDFKVVKGERPLLNNLKELVKGLEILAFESGEVTYSTYLEYKGAFPEVELQPVQELVEEMRVIKDEEEISFIKEAVKRSDEAFSYILDFIKPGLSERDVAVELEYFMKKNGARKIPFDIIVASGERGSLPHGVASDKIIQKGDLITMDLGSWNHHYLSDLTRTVALGSVSPRQKEIYQLVLKAQTEAIKNIKAGLKGKEVDQIARSVIQGASLGEYFGHGLGHGVGLMIHERPTLSQMGEEVLKAGMVVTIEPGIYIPEWGGVRIEDMLVVEEEGGEVLTQSKKELIIL